jgi:FkbM family methyltransferase
MSELIYDIGMDDGDDTDFYCRKGFRVVAVEADPDLCEQATMRFASEIADGRITVINRAIVETPGPVTLTAAQLRAGRPSSRLTTMIMWRAASQRTRLRSPGLRYPS